MIDLIDEICDLGNEDDGDEDSGGCFINSLLN